MPDTLEVFRQCYECGFVGSVFVEASNRIIVCPLCGVLNDFWLVGEQPPEKHINDIEDVND